MVTRIALGLALALALVPGPARADEGEASIDVLPLGGVALLGDDAAPGQSERAYLAGVAARLTYATHDLFAYELEMGAARSGATLYPDVMLETTAGDLERITELARAQVGIRLRLGARYMPTLHVAVGGLARASAASRLIRPDGSVVEGPRSPWAWAFTVSGGLGFDYRINARWMAGAAVSAVQAMSPQRGAHFQSIEGGLHVAYIWYPSW